MKRQLIILTRKAMPYDKKVTIENLIDVFKDYYEGTDYNFVKDLTVTDEDGNTYPTICIGNAIDGYQEWTAKNWKCTKLNNGTSLTKKTDGGEWGDAVAGDYFYCAYDNNENYV